MVDVLTWVKMLRLDVHLGHSWDVASPYFQVYLWGKGVGMDGLVLGVQGSKTKVFTL